MPAVSDGNRRATAREGPPDIWRDGERYQQLVELAPDGILIHDGGWIVLANASAVRLVGATRRSQLVGHPIERFLDPPYLKAVQTELTDSVSPAELAPPVRDILHRLDGSALEVEVRTIAFLDHGQPAVHLVIRDISERLAVERATRLLEERLQEAQRMESVGALAGGVAHEVNNMLQVVLGFSDALLGDVRLPIECAPDVREIIRAVGRAAAVTRQLLDFSRRAVHRPQLVELATALYDAEPMVRRLLRKDQALVVRGDAASRVWADPLQLQQVVINLALNARDAMPNGGTLTITSGDTEVPARLDAVGGVHVPPGRYATLCMQDTGTGMDAATQAQIFDPFFTTKPFGEGTGLGLAAAHGVLTQNNGYITLHSAPGAGSTFTVYLPSLPDPDLASEGVDSPPSVAHDSLAGAIVLVVDDEPAIRALSARILIRGGFRVLLASDGAEALELIDRQGPPRLMLTGPVMGDITGAELARRVSADWPAVPILLMSGASTEELGGPAASGPASDHVQNPFPPELLVARVSEAIAAVERGEWQRA